MDIGKRLKYLRKLYKMSQDDLSALIGASRGNISDWERGRSKPGADALIALSECFNVTTDWILTGQGQEPGIIDMIATEEGTWTLEKKVPIFQKFWKTLIQSYNKKNAKEIDIDKLIEQDGYALIDIEKDMPELFNEIKIIEDAASGIELKETIKLIKKLPPSEIKEVKKFVEYRLSTVQQYNKGGESSTSGNGEEAAGIDKIFA